MTRMMPIAAFFLAVVPAGAYAATGMTIKYGATPYTVSVSCNLAQPLVFLNIRVRNHANVPSAAQTLEAADQTGVLRGTAALPPLDANAAIALSIPLRSPGMNPAAIGGSHTVTVAAGELQSQPLLVQISPALCAQPAPPAVVQRSSRSRLALATPAPPPKLIQNAAARGAAIAAALAVGVPNNLRAANGAPDCATHVGLFGALLCPDMVKNGGLLLVWDWQAGAGPDAIDGFRIYRVDGGLKQLVDTVRNKQSQTLSNVPKPPGGYTGKCYAATAFAGSRESAVSPAYCSGGGSVATTVRLPLANTRSSAQQRDNTQFTSPPDRGMIVGFSYSKLEHTLGDDYHNYIYRTAVAFDVSGLRDRRLVAAKLHMTLASSRGAGNNHSCATDVGTGTEFWWQNHDWLSGQFGYNIAPTDTGPEITADVTPIVATWLRGEPNYGFVLKNADENLGAFIDKSCETAYSNPVLEITYY